MKLGIVGLPNVGKSTLFNAITNAGAQSANYPFCTIEPNVGTVAVPDKRLDYLAQIYNPKKYTPAVIEFVDIAGLVKGAANGEGLGNKFLSHIRSVDAIVHVVRCFESDDIIHVEGSVDPKRDVDIINYELILSDIEILGRRLDKTLKLAKGDKKQAEQAEILKELIAHLEEGNTAASWECPEIFEETFAEVSPLSAKPTIYAANLSESDFESGIEKNENYKALSEIAKTDGAKILPICARIEEELVEMSDEDKEMFLSELGLSGSGLDRLIVEGYSLLGLISFLTAGEEEVRAWTIKAGTLAPAAAGKIHSDLERGFIRAEIVAYDKFVECGGSMATVREKGQLRSEGKEYIMQDGDITLIRFNV